jgi:hypothetical protein
MAIGVCSANCTLVPLVNTVCDKLKCISMDKQVCIDDAARVWLRGMNTA